jgi:DNA-binding MarR family transcriptional regulator
VTAHGVQPADQTAESVLLQQEIALGQLIRRAQQVLTATWTAHVSRSVTSVQYAVLAKLFRYEPLDQARLRKLVGLDRATMHGVVHRLKAAGMLDVRSSPSDARRQDVRLTEFGKSTYLELLPSVRGLQHLLAQRLPDGRVEQLVDLLQIFVEAGHADENSEDVHLS